MTTETPTAPAIQKPPRYYRKIIKIRAIDSPNVRYALEQIKAGIEPDNRILVPGLLSWGDYQKRRATWNKMRQTIGLDAEFWEGADVLLYPPDWIVRANRIALELDAKFYGKVRQAKSMGIDSAEGGDNTTWCIGDEFGIIKLVGERTPDTSMITKRTIRYGREFNIPPQRWIFDRGGGGKQHADRLRDEGYPVQTVAFGEAVTPPTPKVTVYKPYDERIEEQESRSEYVNRRAEMYGEFSKLLDPVYTRGYGIPSDLTELINQMSMIPKLYDKEGRIWMLPKRKKKREDKEQTLIDIIGHSPDELDATVLMVRGLTSQVKSAMAGVAF